MKQITPLLIVISILFMTVFWTDRAGANELVVHTLSYHADRKTDYNEKNFGLGIRQHLTPDWSLQIGVYPNSYRKTTIYGIMQYRLGASWQGYYPGAFAGLASGYRQGLLAGGLMLDSTFHTIRFVPPISKDTTGVLAVEFHLNPL
jgi:hypothetical protein